MNSGYPVILRLEGKTVVIVGGGKVAERKVTGLLGTGAEIVIVSPEATDEIQGLHREGKIVWKQKPFSDGDIKDAFMIFAATNNLEKNQLIRSSAAPHQLVTIADDPDRSNFHVPAHFQRGLLSIAVSTGGASPTLASKIREQLEEQFDDSYEGYLEFLFSKRRWILKEVENASLKRKLLKTIVSSEFLTSDNREDDFIRIYETLLNETGQ
ncbi:NAD(P)-binding protein [Bacillus sp. ISL-40]|uniref:NAD(P)-binding protein n=1 Tax=unclassified Bacillus (in: firmicutes) TaxID=185979 RepID=UPI001BE87A2E|nr:MULTISPECIES: NAD(P)-binding protein [unclassified Bacillus (in: firmicutes)]MBT2696077.1 NAD(P)-binding protein [Bacillus sp. ISL-40]MBT2723263.1 NAD(P)-binding protein [Bacillus sp. ISL-46]MBT2744371.1 NAD(P)-binding protein [Bacillus sp. ISL-77]